MKTKDIGIGTIFIFLLGSLFHFTYELSCNNYFVGIFSPINESIFEHTKLVLYPVIIWYLIYYFKYKKEVNCKLLFSSMIINIIISIIVIPLLYYLYNGMFGIESLIIDLIIFLISILIGFYFSIKSYQNKIKIPWKFILIIILLTYYYLTYNPLQIPFFTPK